MRIVSPTSRSRLLSPIFFLSGAGTVEVDTAARDAGKGIRCDQSYNLEKTWKFANSRETI